MVVNGYTIEPGASLPGVNLPGVNLRGANLRGANLWGANLGGANLRDAILRDAILRYATMPSGETWETYLSVTVPALLTAGGRPVAEVATREHWSCHEWTNCPMAAAFGVDCLEQVPEVHRPAVELFVRLFDSGLIPMPERRQ